MLAAYSLVVQTIKSVKKQENGASKNVFLLLNFVRHFGFTSRRLDKTSPGRGGKAMHSVL